MTTGPGHIALLLASVAMAAGLASWLGTRLLITLLTRAAVLDRPNERSSHTIPTPRGGGIAIVAAILLAWLAVSVAARSVPPPQLLAVLGGAVLLAAISWRDDVAGVPAAVRFATHGIAIALALGALVGVGVPLLFHSALPRALDIAVVGVIWLWFVNLFNFMDGIDGIAGSEAAAIGIGLALFSVFGTGRDPPVAALAIAIAAAAIGFLVWNWAPARIFLGDVGSVPLGYLLAFLLLGVASEGYWKIALILPLYFLADATITLLRRLARGEKVWQAHRSHFYQIATQRGLGHAAVVRRVCLANALLIGLGWAAENGWGLPAVAAAFVVVGVLLAVLLGGGRHPIPAAKPGIEEPPA